MHIEDTLLATIQIATYDFRIQINILIFAINTMINIQTCFNFRATKKCILFYHREYCFDQKKQCKTLETDPERVYILNRENVLRFVF